MMRKSRRVDDSPVRVHIWPAFAGADEGDGGIRRVVEAQLRYLPEHGIELVDEAADADVIACHIKAPPPYFVNYPDKAFVAHNHGLYWAEYEWPNWCLQANVDALELIRRADAVTAPSEWVAQVIRRHTLRRVEAIGHGVNADEWPPGEDRGYVFWNKNRSDPICDPRPIERLAQMMPDQQFISTFGREAPNLRVTGRIPYDQSRDLLRNASIYLCTARETFGIGTLEAMAAGVPIVGWAWGGQREIIRHGKTGWLARPGDFEGLVEGIQWVFENRAKLTRAARAEVGRRYGWSRIIARYADLYRSVALERRRERPKVSVIVTAYKLEEYLPACLKSVEVQSLQDWECIIVDDASPDGCGRIADEFAARDDRFKVIHNQENQYLAGARNTGIAASSGRYLLPLDADDMLSPATLETLAASLDRDRSIHIAYGGMEFLNPDGRRWRSGWPVPYDFARQMAGPGQLMPYASMFRREVWELTGGYRTRCRSSEDCDLWLRSCSYGFRPAMVTDAPTLIYRNREDSMSRTEGWQEHRPWFPWAYDLSLAPAGADGGRRPVLTFEPPAVAVIIPVGPGHERLVVDAVDSVDAQTFRRWECIVVNDTGAKLLTRLPAWVRVVDTKGPVGVAEARNAGIRASTASLFVPLDADDYLQPRAIEALLQIHEQAGGYVYSDWWESWADGRTQVYEAGDYDAKLLTVKGCIHAVTALYPREAWERVGGFDPSLVGWEDWDLQLALADIGVCGSRVPMPLFTYRKDAGRRRDENYAGFEEAKASMIGKWGRLWDGGEELMGCRSCPGGGGRTVRPASPGPAREARQALDGDDVVMVEYTGDSRGARTFRGPTTGTSYRFDAAPTSRMRYVYRSDVSIFERRKDFQVREVPPQEPPPAEGQAPTLVASELPHR